MARGILDGEIRIGEGDMSKTRWLLVLTLAVSACALALFAGPPGGKDWKVSFREYDVPTPNSRPHDPAVGPDGSLWYTGQLANKLGRLDPATGAIREFPLKTPDSGPHGLFVDGEGFVWYTGNFKAHIGRLDPRTGEVKEFPMPDPRARDPHSLVLGRDGNIYFTVQNANMIGRLVPATGEVRLKDVPTPSARPYGIVIGPDGAPYFCESAGGKIGRIDPEGRGASSTCRGGPAAAARHRENGATLHRHGPWRPGPSLIPSPGW
jgi:streptogramin lyase